MNYIKVWAHDLAQQEGKGGPTDQGEGIPSVLVVLVAGQTGQWRSRTAATVAGTPGAAEGGRRAGDGREDAGPQPQVVLD